MGKPDMNNRDGTDKVLENTSNRVLSSEKREDLWAIIIAAAVLVICSIAPDAVYTFFKKSLFLF